MKLVRIGIDETRIVELEEFESADHLIAFQRALARPMHRGWHAPVTSRRESEA
jgi:hypothetical protein